MGKYFPEINFTGTKIGAIVRRGGQGPLPEHRNCRRSVLEALIIHKAGIYRETEPLYEVRCELKKYKGMDIHALLRGQRN